MVVLSARIFLTSLTRHFSLSKFYGSLKLMLSKNNLLLQLSIVLDISYFRQEILHLQTLYVYRVAYDL
jgi:hypothetical protein